ncbi:protein kinase domain-containing protein [Thermomonas brevis]
MTSDHDSQWAAVTALFDRLLELPPAQREPQLRAAGVTTAVAERVRSMLAALEAQPDFLERPAQPEATAGQPGSLPGGSRIGAFVVDRLVGRGGMGEVYLAHREDAGFAQRVALKLVRAEAAARLPQFENERRILAGLEHPGIARLVDGGVAPDGRPFMAMEFVEGQDILAYATTHALDLEARLRLFGQVCEAVDFAHRRLVVHRDLKPANILVDGDGRVRLLDFGIARLLDGSDGSQTQALLTPDYAAPEQLEGGAITTATDVHALGVVLYELLVGQRPWMLADLPLPAGLKRRLEADPAPPSVRGGAAGPVPAARLQGDLDAIVLKALRREPALRYPGAAALWDDLQRHLRREPVQARGDARGYRLRRFVARHRLGVAAGAAVFAALALGLAGMAWQARKAAMERDQVLREMARTEAVKNSLLLMFRTAGESADSDGTTAKQVLDQSARRLRDQYRDQPETRGDLVETLGSLYLYMNDYDGAVPLLQGYLDDPSSGADAAKRADIGVLLAEAELRRGDAVAARKRLDAAQAFWNADAQRYRKPLIGSRQLQAQIEKEESGLPASIRTLQQALLEHDAYFGRRNIETANILNSLGIAYQANGDIDKADAAFRDSWAVHQALGNDRSAAALLTLGNWATVAYRKQDLQRAETLLAHASTLRGELYGASAALAAMQGNLGKIVLRAGRPRDALARLAPALAMARQYTGDHSPLTVAILQSQVEASLALRDVPAAETLLAQAKDAARANSGETQVLYALCMGLEARLRLAQGRAAEARRLADAMAGIIAGLGDAGAPYAPEVQRLRAELAGAAT